MRLQFIAFAILALSTAVVSALDVTHAHAVPREEATQGINTKTSVVNYEESMMPLILATVSNRILWLPVTSTQYYHSIWWCSAVLCLKSPTASPSRRQNMIRTSKPTKKAKSRAPTSLIAALTEAPYHDQIDPIRYPVPLITHAPSSSVSTLTEAPYRDQIDPIKYPVALITHAPSSSVIIKNDD